MSLQVRSASQLNQSSNDEVVSNISHRSIAGCKHRPPTIPEFRAWLVARFAASLGEA